MRALACIVASIVFAGGDARADRLGFGAWLHYEVSELHAIDQMTPASTDMVLAGARLGGFVGRRVAYAAQLDFAFGATIGASGFLYEVGLLPVGIALRPSLRSVIALATGVGVSGAVGTLDDAVALPLELTAEVTLGPLRLLARGRASWVGGADGRQNGAPSVRWADEVEATVGLRVGRRYDRFGFRSGNGYFVGASYRELAGTQFAGVVIGYSLDAGTEMSGKRF